MAAAIGGDSMLQILRGQLLFRRRQNSRYSKSIERQLLRRQNGPVSSDGVAFTTLVLTETLVTPSATLTEILTVAPTQLPTSPQPDRLPSTGNGDPAGSSTSDMTTTTMATTTMASPTSSSAHSRTSGSTLVTAPAQNSPTGAPVASSSSSGMNTKVIIPAIVCSALFLVVVAFLLGYFIRRRKNQRLDQPDRESVVINEIERGGYGADGDGGYGTAGSRSEKQQPQTTSRTIVPNISIDPSPARTRSLSKGTSQSKEGLLQSDYTKLGPDTSYAAEREKRHAMAMFRRSTAQDSATIPHHLRHLRPESVSTDGLRSPGLHVPEDFELPRPAPAIPNGTDRISKIGMALSTSDKSVQEDNISAIIQEDIRQPAQTRGVAFQGAHTMFFEETPPLYSVASNSYFGGGSAPAKSNAPPRSEPLPEFGTVGSAHSSNKSRFAGRSDIATPSPPGTPTRSSQDQDQDTSAGSRRSSRRGSAIFGLAAATLAHAAESSTRRVRPKSWDRKGRKDRRRQSRGRGVAAPAGLEKRKGNKSRSRSRGNVAWTAWFDSSDEGEEDDRAADVVEPIPLPGGIVTAKSQRKKRVIFNSTSDISEHPTVSSSRTRATSNT
ncbi:hypothetical protein TWF694_002280 [Orbilia ellipsospora]|uniref:Uncharacterized protein n=1 Tax=Orbilia ellipsospora TaxID=2528407 RepID=A0AAV9X2Q7_9PEZI